MSARTSSARGGVTELSHVFTLKHRNPDRSLSSFHALFTCTRKLNRHLQMTHCIIQTLLVFLPFHKPGTGETSNPPRWEKKKEFVSHCVTSFSLLILFIKLSIRMMKLTRRRSKGFSSDFWDGCFCFQSPLIACPHFSS